MEEFKIELYQNENNQHFPEYKSLSSMESELIQGYISNKLGLNDSQDLLLIVKTLSTQQICIDDCNAKDENFSLSNTAKFIGITPKERVYVNWYRFDEIDVFNFNDLAKFFDDIWFSGADDIDIFDETYDWILSIRHDGALFVLKPARPDM